MVNTRLVVLTVHFGFSSYRPEIFKPLVIHRKQSNMITLLIVSRILVHATARCNIGLET